MPKPMPAARRRWQATLIIALFFLAVIAAAGTGWWYARESPPHQGPIVLISVDAMQARQLHAYGATRTDTPAIDALAADGVLFTRAYAHSPQTLPAHASLLTGRLPFEHGVRDDAGYRLAEDARTIAEQLRSRGFETGGVVSSVLLRRTSGVAQGFSFFDADIPAQEATLPPALERNGLDTYSVAEQWMRARSGQRYFLFLEVDRASADAVVSRIVQHLKDRDLYDGATIVLTAAHGDPTAGVRLDDRSLAIPLIVKQPEGEGAGRNVPMAVQQIDIAPTLLDLVRAPVPGGLRGRSLRPVLDSDDATLPVVPIYAETLEAAWRVGGAPVFAITMNGYRLTRGATESVSRIDESAAETVDEALAARLRDALDRLLQGMRVGPPADLTPADASTFAAFGYLPPLRAPQPPAGPGDPEAQARLVEAHRAAAHAVSRRDYADAVARLRDLLRTHPDLAAVQFQIGTLLTRTGNFADGVAALKTAAMMRPDDPDIARALSAAYLRAHEVEDAQAQALAAVTLAEKSGSPQLRADALEIAARVALAANDPEAAARHAQEADKADPTLSLSSFVRGRIAYDEGRYDDALAALQETARTVHERDRELYELHLYLGDTLARLDRYTDAENEFREELRTFPDSISAFTSLAMLYRASNREDAVDETIQNLVIAAPTPEGYAAAARLWTIVGERAKADAIRADARRRFRADLPATTSR